ncbi:hypothetical protein AHMF7605_26160 [Adhaeribacter arboris]|uniref:Antirepressor protein ant N-terminal domain-containing protein n=1 Tax=Adhaeribacter arboris TaxID=2072846 RepID=A0A2T2YMJ7_9BACT|nr:phage antirepressor N-terminal domain-containing protein [Adhaeribacter arboris]PSR56730.1 hypothetical protein AHMF7605_26160 [Adhaeribacter arboris]
MREQAPIEKLEFEDKIIGIITLDHQNLIPVKVICELLELEYRWQAKTLQESPFFSSLLKTTRARTGEGDQRKMLCLPAEEVEPWIHGVPDQDRTQQQRQKKQAFLLWWRQQRRFFFPNQRNNGQLNQQELLLEQLIEQSQRNLVQERSNLQKYKVALAQVHQEKYGKSPGRDTVNNDLEKAAINQIPEREADMLRLLLNNRAYISKSRKIPSRHLEVQVREVQNQEIEKRMQLNA